MADRTGSSAPRGPDDWIERVRAASDIVEVISQTVPLKRVGRNMVGLCPFHAEKTPSFSVQPERQFYHCFSCKAGGDVFKFVQETERLGFLEAAELLSRRAGIPIPERRAAERGSRTPILDALEEAAAAYERWLGDPATGRAARAYLEKRGISYETQREFRLGVALPGWDGLTTQLRGRCSEEALIGAGLAARRESGSGLYDRFRNRLMVPLISPGGQVVGFGARALDPADVPKYLNSPETAVYHKGTFLYALEQARRKLEPEGEVVVVEGYFDTIALHQAGIRNVVATSGTALTADQARLLKRTSARVALTYDGDQAGQEAMMRSLGTLLSAGLEVVVVDLPAGVDPDQLVKDGGVAAWDEARRAAADPVEFVQRHGLRRAARAEAGGTADPRERALQAVVKLAAGMEDPIRTRLLLERANQVFGIPEAVLSRAVGLQRTGQVSSRPIEMAVRQQRQGASHAERALLQALLLAPEQRAAARETLHITDFLDPDCADLAAAIWNSDGTPEGSEPGAALARELMATAIEGGEWAKTAVAGIRMLKARNLQREQQATRSQVAELQRQGVANDDPRMKELMQRSIDLAAALRN